MSSHREIRDWNGRDFARFWSKVKITSPDECWVWTGTTNRGYGAFSMGEDDKWTSYLAHRVAWAMAHRTLYIPLHVLHKCDNPPCVNPMHLWLGDDFDNMQDCIQKGRVSVKGRFGQGNHHIHAILDAGKVITIRRLFSKGEDSYKSLAQRFGVAPTTIQAIVERRTWAWVDSASHTEHDTCKVNIKRQGM